MSRVPYFLFYFLFLFFFWWGAIAYVWAGKSQSKLGSHNMEKWKFGKSLVNFSNASRSTVS